MQPRIVRKNAVGSPSEDWLTLETAAGDPNILQPTCNFSFHKLGRHISAN